MGFYIKELTVNEISEIQKAENLIIYGAGKVCKELIEILNSRGINRFYIAVSKADVNQYVSGKHVVNIDSLASLNNNSLVVIAVNSRSVQGEIKDTLYRLHFKHYFALGDDLQYCKMKENEKKIDNRLRKKKSLSGKINVAFICHRPQVWNTTRTIYDAMKEDDAFDVSIIAIPSRKCYPDKGFCHNEFESEGAENFFGPMHCINGYNYSTGECVDIIDHSFDYVFFQQPYNIMLPDKYNSNVISEFAKICYVAYGYEMMRGEVIEGSHPEDFFRNVSFYFAQDKYNQDYTEEYLNRKKNSFTKSILTGYPKFDDVITVTKPKNEKGLKAVWCPRWTDTEGNCNFIDYGELLPELFDEKDDMKLIFRPHPQMRVDINAKDNRKSADLKHIIDGIKAKNNTDIDEKDDYKEAFSWSDCLIADMTSLMGDYFLTGKPVIYCHKIDCFSEAGRHLSEGFYWVRNWNELRSTIEMLASGEDPLFEKRQQIIKEHYYLPEGGAGMRIKEYIKADALK